MIAATRMTTTPANASSPERESVASSVNAAHAPSSKSMSAAFLRPCVKLAYASSSAAVAITMQHIDRQFAS